MGKSFIASFGMLATLALGFLAPAALGNSTVVQWTTGTGANNAYYERIDLHPAGAVLTFNAAQSAAAALTFNTGTQTLHGELAVLDGDYSDAFTFIHNNVMYLSGNAAPDSEMYWVGASSPTGNLPPNDAKLSDWTWITGAGVPDSVASTWNIDHAEGAGAEGAGFFQSGSSQLWDYIETASSNQAFGYVVEFPQAVPEPTTLAIGVLAALTLVSRRRQRTP